MIARRISLKRLVGLRDKIIRLSRRPEGVQIDELRAIALRDYQIRQQLRNLKLQGRIERRGSFKWGSYHYVPKALRRNGGTDGFDEDDDSVVSTAGEEAFPEAAEKPEGTGPGDDDGDNGDEDDGDDADVIDVEPIGSY
jgi:hypothetical protein